MSEGRGFRFHPTDDEIVRDYLMEKKRNPEFECFIRAVELYDHEPWVLRHQRDPCYSEYHWYYFVKKSPKGHKRLLEDGSSTKKDKREGWNKRPTLKPIMDHSGEETKIIARKYSYTYYVYNKINNYSAPTDWTMEEYELDDGYEWRICRLFYTDWKEFYDRPRLTGREQPGFSWGALKQIYESLNSRKNIGESVEPYLFTYGFRFNPTDQELLTLYLTPKASSAESVSFIQEVDLYSKEPWLLNHHRCPFYKDQEWFYFVKKASSRREKLNLMWKKKSWRINAESVRIEGIGSKTKYSFNYNESYMSRTGWRVEEFELSSRSQWTLCKLTYNNNGCIVNDVPTRGGVEHPKLEWEALKNLHEVV